MPLLDDPHDPVAERLEADLWFRDSDRQYVETLTRQIILQRASVVFISPNPTVLDHYGRLLVQKLRRGREIETAVLFETNKEFLIQRFNALLAPLSLDTARKPAQPEQPAQAWLLQIYSDEQLAEAQLLSRLVSDFPGVNVSLILLASPYVAQPFLSGGPGKTMLQWAIDSPEPAELNTLLAAADQTGRGPECRELLERLGHVPPAPRIPERAPEPLDPADADARAELEATVASLRNRQNLAAEPTAARRKPLPPRSAPPTQPKTTRPPGRLTKVILVIFVLVFAAAAAWLFWAGDTLNPATETISTEISVPGNGTTPTENPPLTDAASSTIAPTIPPPTGAEPGEQLPAPPSEREMLPLESGNGPAPTQKPHAR